ncbi:EthD family reductase [Hephaestia sp. GCM10023244]|uniref:EthD family reductase n=1 Tax=unclassified Hephaestia TaxID=2631281 RepID=UPI00207797D3|nr:EthD family reductase [Hephaestia sp. MAHUQ-44]MCM8732046.1 EthD family reductase [Hephaestia sp. MAHUQ-44]
MAEPIAPPRELPHFKCTQFIRRAPSLSAEALLDHWHQHRAPLLRRLPGLTGLTFNTVNRQRSPDAPYDAVIELWFANAAAYAHAVDAADPDLIDALARDRPAFIQDDFLGLFSREVIVRPVPPQAGRPRAKRIGLVGRQPGTPRDRFFDEWVHHHAPAADSQPGLEGYVLNLRAQDRFLDAPWDGYAELWWPDWDAFEAASRAIRSSVGARLGFFHSHLLLYLDEHEEIAPPGRETANG